MDVSILVPTKNRSDFVIRLLQYYNDVDYRGHIFIGDSSETFHVERTKAAIKNLRGNFEIVYREYPELNNAESIHELLTLISTKYSVILPDDDFLVPSSVGKCIEFLEGNSDYIAAHGVGILFQLKKGNDIYGPIASSGYYLQRPIEKESASQRLIDHLTHYSVTLFSVHRTAQMRLMYKQVSALSDKTFALELLPCCLSVIFGKTKQLDCLSLVRQVHAQRYLLPDVYDWITNENWSLAFRYFESCLVTAISHQDKIGLDDIRQVVKQAFWSYLAQSMFRSWQQKYALSHVNILHNAAKNIPRLDSFWQKIRATLRVSEMSLASLLNPSSPYYADFLPVYRVVTTPPRKF